MASHGAMKERAASEPAQPKKMPKEFAEMTLRKAENGGAVAEHRFTSYDHKPETHVFGENEGHKLAAHIEKHLEMSMPGRAKGTVAEREEGEEGKD